jgi:hypothetical protein
MKSHTQAAAVIAAKWALGLSAGFILGPIVMRFGSGIEIPGNMVAQRLVFGIAWFVIIFFCLWVWGTLSKKNPVTGAKFETEVEPTDTQASVQKVGNIESSNSTPASKWNYVGIGVSVFMLLFLFLPQIISGTLANQYYLGAAFWVGVIIYSSLNILRARTN